MSEEDIRLFSGQQILGDWILSIKVIIEVTNIYVKKER